MVEYDFDRMREEITSHIEEIIGEKSYIEKIFFLRKVLVHYYRVKELLKIEPTKVFKYWEYISTDEMRKIVEDVYYAEMGKL